MTAMVPDDTGRLDAAQVQRLYWARPVPGRVPAVGDQLLYRHELAGPLSTVVVQRVVMDDHDDPNVWVDGRVRRDPAPLVEFAYGPVRVAAREARVPGQPGWVWPAGHGEDPR